jgi:diphthamide synthase (EF-2-diphthine--ammonia ligase)
MAIQKYALIRGVEISFVSADVEPGNEDTHAREISNANGGDCFRVRDAAHEASLVTESAQVAGFLAEVEGMSIGAMTALQQKRLLAIVCRKLGIRVRP